MEETVTRKNNICKLWVQGRCIRNPCEFSHISTRDRNLQRRKIWKDLNTPKKHLPEVEYIGRLNLISKFIGHEKAITGIILPDGHDKLYSASKDLTVRSWDIDTHQCTSSHTNEVVVGCLLAAGDWMFAGAPNTVRARNLQSDTLYELNGSGGQTHCMAVSADILFVGTEDGRILIWKWRPKMNCFEQYAMLEEHSATVCALTADSTRLYSGSKDCSIKVWDIQTLECLQTILGHTREVTSLLLWDKTILVSASLDKTLKFWGPSPTKSGRIEMAFEKKLDHGVVTVAGMVDEKKQTIILCSFENHVVLYDLPLFNERGRIISRNPIRVIKRGDHLSFFTGDAGGEICAWEMAGDTSTTSL